MWTFIICLFFSKTLLLTPNFVNIDKGTDNYTLNLNVPISAITTGATVQVDVSEMILKDRKNFNLQKIRRSISDTFPEGSIRAILIAKNKKIILTYQGGTLVNNFSARLLLSTNEVPTGVDFNAVTIKSDVKLERVKIYWKNYKK